LFIHKAIYQFYKLIVIAGLAAMLLDLDHVVAAGSLSLYDITHLPARPVTHSLLFSAACGILASILSYSRINGWLIFCVLASHVVRDASTGMTPFLWPLPVDHLPVVASYSLQVGLFLITTIISSLWKRNMQNKRPAVFGNKYSLKINNNRELDVRSP